MTQEMVLGDLFDQRNHLERKFEVYDAENPHIWPLFVRFTFETIERGYQHYSVNGIFERIRWHTSVEAKPAPGDPPNPDSGGSLKINDHYRAYYARKFNDTFPRYDGYFRTRKLRAA